MNSESDHKPGRKIPSSSASGNAKTMVLFGGALLIATAIANEALTPAPHGPLWRVIVAILAFLYLWWLASLLFDLVFVWQRYIQNDAAHRFLRTRVQRKNLKPSEGSHQH